jgi:hypothetical protein
MIFSAYTDEQIKFILEKKQKKNIRWSEVVSEYNQKFNDKKSIDAIRKTYERYKDIDFSKDKFITNLKDVFRTKKINSKTSNENKELLHFLTENDIIKETIQDIIKNTKFKIFSAPKITNKKTIDRTIIAHLSDVHYGAIIKKKHNGDINEYNETIAARRTAYFFWQIAEYAKNNIKIQI